MSSVVNRVYTAYRTLAAFHACDKPIRVIRGPIGSGKSAACAVEMLRRAQETPPSSDGVRRSRGLIVRNTLQQLKSTCLVTWMEWFRPISSYKVSDATIQVRFTGSDGIPVESDILLLPLDTEENVQRLLSLELTFAWISECSEVPIEMFHAAFSRCGRYPSRANLADYYYACWGETNSFSEDSPYYDYLELDRPSNVGYFVQPGAFEPNAEGRENLPPRYYEDLLESNGDTWVDRYLHNKIVASLSGQAVFAQTFRSEDMVKDELIWTPVRPVVLGMDTGRHPAFVAGQLDARGRLLVLASDFGENMGLELFLTTKVKPRLAELFPDGMFFVSMDPAGRQRSQIGEESVQDACRRLGFSTVLASTNSVAPRLRAVERYMSLYLDGGPGLLIDRRHNRELIRALQHDYRYKRKKDGVLEEVPDKQHPASDLCLHVATRTATRRGVLPLGEVRVGDAVRGPTGAWVEVGARLLREAPLVRVCWSDGELLCTPDHPLAVWQGETYCFTRADALQYGDLLVAEDPSWASGDSPTRASAPSPAPASTAERRSRRRSGGSTRAKGASAPGHAGRLLRALATVSRWMGSGSAETLVLATSGTSTRLTVAPAEFHSTAFCGRKPTAQCPTGLLSTIVTTTARTTRSPTLSSCVVASMRACMFASAWLRALWRRLAPLRMPPLPRGTVAPLAASGTGSTLSASLPCAIRSELFSSARDVANSTSASCAVPARSSTLAVKRVVSVSSAGRGVVVSLTIPDGHQFFSGGVLSHNCDGLQYLALGVGSSTLARQLARRAGHGVVPERARITPAAWT